MPKFTNLEIYALRTLERNHPLTFDEIQSHGINLDALECLEGQFSDQLVARVYHYGWTITDEGITAARLLEEQTND